VNPAGCVVFVKQHCGVLCIEKYADGLDKKPSAKKEAIDNVAFSYSELLEVCTCLPKKKVCMCARAYV
jgi:hypothetical protein